jgi:hypothetical protein
MELLGILFCLVFLMIALVAIDQFVSLLTRREFKATRMSFNDTSSDNTIVLDIEVKADKEIKESVEA